MRQTLFDMAYMFTFYKNIGKINATGIIKIFIFDNKF